MFRDLTVTPRKRLGHTVATCGVLGLVLLALGCRTYQIEPTVQAYATGQLEQALESTGPRPWWNFWNKRYPHDELAWLLEEGKILQDLGRYAESGDKLNEALARFTAIEEQQASISITDEIDGVLRGLVWMDYRASFPLAIHGYALLALSDLAAGNLQNAGAACRNASKWQDEILLHRQKQIERAEKLSQESKLDFDKLLADKQNKQHVSAEYLNQHVSSAYQNYLNPFASLVSGIIFALQGDGNRSRELFSEVLGMVPENEYVRQLAAQQIRADRNVVLVLYERGMAPQKVEQRITVPTPALGITTVAWPRLEFQPPLVSHVIAEADGRDYPTQTLASVDSIIASQFRHELTGILVRTLVATVAREAASKVIDEKARKDVVGNVLRVLSQLWKIGASAADLRTWRTIGSEIQFAALPRPTDGELQLRLIGHGGGAIASDALRVDSDVTVVRIRSIGAHTFRVDPIWSQGESAVGLQPTGSIERKE